MATGTIHYGDQVVALSGSPAGLLRVIFVRDMFTRDNKTGILQALQLLRVRQLTDEPDSPRIGGTLIDLYDTEVALVATREQVP